MAVYNEILVGRWNRFIQKLTGIKGGPPARQLSSEIAIEHEIQTGVENRYLEGWERFGFVINQAGAAAQTSDIQLRNPVGSNVIAVIEQIIISNTQAAAETGFVEIGPRSTDFTTIVPLTVGRLDARSRPNPTLIASKQNSGAALGAVMQYANSTNTASSLILTQNQELTILPGDAMVVDGQTVNQALQISTIWRERFLEDSERF